MVSNKNQYSPDFVTSPGESLLDTLEAIGMSQAELHRRTGISGKHINEIIKGKYRITPDFALLLEKVVGVPASFWNNRQKRYDEYLAKCKEAEMLERKKSWLSNFPIKAMKKFDYIEEGMDDVDIFKEVLALLQVGSPEAFDQNLKVCEAKYRKSASFAVNNYALAAWLGKGREKAREVHSDEFDKNRFLSSLNEIRKLTCKSPREFIPLIKDKCSESGVKFVLVPELPQMPVYAATYWMQGNPVIQQNIRGKMEDLFWFTLFHEAAHVLLHEKKKAIYLDAGNSTGKEEEEANAFAADFLVPQNSLFEFGKSIETASYQNQAELIRKFAESQNISPGIIVGQLQHHRFIRFSHHNDMKTNYSGQTEQFY